MKKNITQFKPKKMKIHYHDGTTPTVKIFKSFEYKGYIWCIHRSIECPDRWTISEYHTGTALIQKKNSHVYAKEQGIGILDTKSKRTITKAIKSFPEINDVWTMRNEVLKEIK